MTQRDAVVKVMEQNGGFATFGYLNQHVLRVPGIKSDASEPFANIRRIVQTHKRVFFRIKPGLWALLSHKNRLPGDIIPSTSAPKAARELFDHSYYQGVLLEVGKKQRYQTFVPDQDKNKAFLRTTLGNTRTLQHIYPFSYDATVKRARMIDVIWFNRRKMPQAVFEVEHSTDFTSALSKYVLLQDFNAQLFIVSDQNRWQAFREKISRDEYYPIKDRVNFVNYDTVAEWYGKSMGANRFELLP